MTSKVTSFKLDLKKRCRFCFLPMGEFSKEWMFKTYFEKFNFYFAKPINEILANLDIPHVIFFKDL